VFVGSQAEQAVKVFNLFGVYQYSLPAPAGYQWAGMDVWGDFIDFVNKSTATIYNRLTQAYQTVHFEGIQHIRDLALTAQGFYVLSANKLYLYSTKPQ
jgi:hypothetical protein